MLLFLDESGDLGFDWSKSGTSAKFIITILICRDMQIYRQFQKAVTRTLRHKLNPKSKRKRIVQELKGSATNFAVKKYFYSHLPMDGWELHSIILNKKRVYDYLQTKPGKKKLYNFLARNLLEHICVKLDSPTISLTVDRCKNTEEIKDFNGYIANQLEALLPLETRLYIHHEDSQTNAGLQATDMFCWGIARKHGGNLATQDWEWYRLFHSRIAQEIRYL